MAELLNADQQKQFVRDLLNPTLTVTEIQHTYHLTISDYNYYRQKLRPLVNECRKLQTEKEKSLFRLAINRERLTDIFEEIENLILYKRLYPCSLVLHTVDQEIENLTILYSQVDASLKEIIVPLKIKLP